MGYSWNQQPWGLGVLCRRLASAQAAGCRRVCPELLILSLVVPSLKQEDHSQQAACVKAGWGGNWEDQLGTNSAHTSLLSGALRTTKHPLFSVHSAPMCMTQGATETQRQKNMACNVLPVHRVLVIEHGQSGRHLHLTSGIRVLDSIMM